MMDRPLFTPPALSARGIVKRYGTAAANRDISLTLEYGKIHALLGENGAGKSTLASILSGLTVPDEGELQIDGRPIAFKRPADALRLGIGLAQQHFSLIPAFTVLENLILGWEPGGMLRLDKKRAEKEIRQTLDRFGLDLPLHRPAGSLAVGMRQQVEIARILYRRARIVLFDEPTAALVSSEADRFLAIIETLRKQGLAILFITHRLPEALCAADEITVLRKGETVLQGRRDRLTPDSIAAAIVGEKLPEETYEFPGPGATILSLQNLSTQEKKEDKVSLHSLSLEVREREIVGIAGVAGNGQEELVEAILGLNPICEGRILLDGLDIARLNVSQRRELGLALIPQDRAQNALLPDLPLFDNYLLNHTYFHRWGKWRIKKTPLEAPMQECVREYEIAAPSLQTPPRQLSGGHQQRAVISRELLAQPKIVIAHNPTRGLDLRASRFVRETLHRIAAEGAGAVLFSPELGELFLLCQRIAVIHRGRLTETKRRDEWTAAELGRAMTGAQA
ncbi:MAG: ABC transporter ATP-binding protein [Candidatus Omnitrophota bacterium]